MDRTSSLNLYGLVREVYGLRRDHCSLYIKTKYSFSFQVEVHIWQSFPKQVLNLGDNTTAC